MPRVRRLDPSFTDLRGLETEGVCERTPLQYGRNPNKSWPFLFSVQAGHVLVNQAKRSSRYESAAKEVGDAMM